MVTNNFAIYGLKTVAELAGDFLYFPVWWYSRGLAKTAVGLWNFLRNRERALGLFVWMKNIFTPMYGQQDFAGAAISFFIRLIQIIVRGIAFLFWVAVAAGCFLLWLALPLAVAVEIVYQII